MKFFKVAFALTLFLSTVPNAWGQDIPREAQEQKELQKDFSAGQPVPFHIVHTGPGAYKSPDGSYLTITPKEDGTKEIREFDQDGRIVNRSFVEEAAAQDKAGGIIVKKRTSKVDNFGQVLSRKTRFYRLDNKKDHHAPVVVHQGGSKNCSSHQDCIER